jgi:hypothetical protein
MFRNIQPGSTPELELRMLFQPAGGELFHRAAEADSYRGLVAALVKDSAYETGTPLDRLTRRLQIAHEVALLGGIDDRPITVADRDDEDVINVSSDQSLISSLERVGYLSIREMADMTQ